MALNLPDGCSVGDLPGFRPIDEAYDTAEERFEDTDIEEQIGIIEVVCSEAFLEECLNEAIMMDDDDYDEWIDYVEATDLQLRKMIDYVWGIDRYKERIMDYIVEEY